MRNRSRVSIHFDWSKQLGDPNENKILPERKKRMRRMRRSLPQRDTLITDIRFSGVLSQTDRRYVRMVRNNSMDKRSIDNNPAFVPQGCFAEPSSVLSQLQNQGFLIPYADLNKALISKASAILAFKRQTLIERSGFDADLFALRNGDYLHQPEHDGNENTNEQFEVTFPRNSNLSRKAGTHQEYVEGLSRLMKRQDVLILALAASFAPLLLRFSPLDGNFGFQFTGPAACGKTTALKLAASVWGAPSVGYEIQDAEIFHYLGLAEKLSTCNDHPLLLTNFDRWFALETQREKLELVRKFGGALDHKLEGTEGASTLSTRLIILGESRLRVEELCGNEGAADARLGGRLIQIAIPEDRTGKVVARLPKGIASSAKMIGLLNELVSQHYGHAGPLLAERLLRSVMKDEDAIRAKVLRCIDDFVAQSQVDLNNGSDSLTAHRFGLVYAAGRFAQSIGALPPGIKMKSAIIKCFRLHQSARRDVPLLQRLEALLNDPDVVDLGSEKKLPIIKNKRYASAIAFLRTSKDRRQLYVRQRDIIRILPDWDLIKKTGDYMKMLEFEREDRNGVMHHHHTVKRKLGAGREQERVICFNMPLSQAI